MKYSYIFGKYPNKKWTTEIDEAAHRLKNKISQLEVQSLSIGEDIKRFFGHKQQSLDTNLVKYSYQLAWAISSLEMDKSDMVVIDHGGGTGMFGLLCKEFGIGTVVYNDISDNWTRDAETIATQLGLPSEHYIIGEIDHLFAYLKSNSISAHALVSYNTIEHVFDMDDLIDKIAMNTEKGFAVFMSTGANGYNKSITKSIIPLQLVAENGDPKTKLFGTGKPYFEIRKDIISGHGPQLSESEVDQMARATRGMIEPSIKQAIDSYLVNKKMPVEPKHKTNTCDPYSGYWAEHFMDPNDLKTRLISNNFQARVLMGYYGKPKSAVKRMIGGVLNLAISIFESKSIGMASYWTVYGVK